jgi:hypothetical protein
VTDDRPRHLRLDAFELLEALVAHGADFVVIGALAVAAHGYPRATKGVDIVPAPATEHLERLLEALAAVDAEPLELGDFRPDELVPLDLEGLAAGGNWVLRTRFGRLDLLQYVAGMPSYEQLKAAAVSRELAGRKVHVRFCGYDHLIAMKHAAGRDLDLIDIAELERARGGEEPGRERS